MTKPVLPTKLRQKGFESVQKGYRSADARPLFFENELLYCELTVASDIQKGLLLVSFVAVGNYCRGMLKKAFLFRFALHERRTSVFLQTKRLSFAENFLTVLESYLLLQTKSLSFAQTFPYCYPKQSFFALRFPFQPPLTYCLQRLQLFF